VLTLTAASAALAAPGTTARSSTRGNGGVQQLDSRAHQALLSLYALDSRLQAWRGRVATLGATATALRHRRESLRQELGAAQATLKVGQHQLGLNLRTLYEQGTVDPMAVMLGAKSLAKGLGQLDHLARLTDQSRQIVAATGAARRRLLRSQARLAAEGRRLERSLLAARQAERQLAASAASRLAYVSSLRAQARMQAARVQTVVATAQAAQQTSQQLAPTTTAPPPAGGRQLVVSATCYDLPGRTATGMPVGIGVVAVDPSVIPLGSRMQIPGYGSGVAADVGSGIAGATIDLWMPPSQCAAWGRRTVTITIF
jgi:3D (Asp-Asp-Asp) domain-containing protein